VCEGNSQNAKSKLLRKTKPGLVGAYEKTRLRFVVGHNWSLCLNTKGVDTFPCLKIGLKSVEGTNELSDLHHFSGILGKWYLFQMLLLSAWNVAVISFSLL